MTPAEQVADQLAVTAAAVEPTTPQAVIDLLTAPKPTSPSGRMTGPEHYAEAERMLTDVLADKTGVSFHRELRTVCAQVHATLALAAATALGAQTSTPGAVYQEWHNAAGPASAKAVAS